MNAAKITSLPTFSGKMGEVITEEKKVATILNKLGENYSQVKSFIDYGETKTVQDVEKMVVARFKDLQAINMGKTTGNSHALIASAGKKSSGRKGRGKGRIVCYLCGSVGHVRGDCPNLDRGRHAGASARMGEDED
ncbi:unnamed protein product, partial [Choristocarpus tenellus]